jgi:hypothetical protein
MNKLFYLLSAFAEFSIFLKTRFAFTHETVIFANFYKHFCFSEDLETPREAVIYARNTAKIYFIMLTVHKLADALVVYDRSELLQLPRFLKAVKLNRVIPVMPKQNVFWLRILSK